MADWFGAPHVAAAPPGEVAGLDRRELERLCREATRALIEACRARPARPAESAGSFDSRAAMAAANLRLRLLREGQRPLERGIG